MPMSAKEHLTDDEKQWAAAGLGVQASAMHKTKPREGDMTGRTRFRVEPTGWGPWAKPLVVLQAEYLTTRGGPDNYDPHWHEDLVPVWRDVRPEHLPEFEARVRGRSEKQGASARDDTLAAPAGRYLIGQRVILNGVEIGTVCAPRNNALPNTDTEVWVHSPSRGFANRYAVRSVQPLPGGQL